MPYEIAVPWLPENVVEQALKADCRKILIVHDLYAAGAMRRKLQDAVPDCQVTVGSFFTKCDKPELPGDVALDSEADFKRFFEENQFDLLISLDGPENIQNYHRRLAVDGSGTYNTVVNNILKIKNKYPDYFN